MNVGYRYDELNRLESVDDTSTGLPTRTTGYTYNANGSLETVTQPNAVVHTYGYDALNRLRGLVVSRSTTLIHTYEYKLNPTGHRHQVVENSAKTTTYDYDDLYRLTGETVVGDSHANNGEIGYTLDKVGNRQSRTSQLAALNSQLGLTYNARDWLAGDTYTANGSTQASSQLSALNPQLAGTDTYDFEEHLILRTKTDGATINVSYDADGHRIQKILLDASAQPVSTTNWLVDTNNLTGYAQVVEERTISGGASPTSLVRAYTYGASLISQATSLNAAPATLSYFTHDGHGNVRELTDVTGSVNNRYDYDAFGNLVYRAGATSNAYLYCGEQFDADLGLYYLRARYLNTDSGRFWSIDEFEGKEADPISLHKYLYASADPVNNSDPSGYITLAEIKEVVVIQGRTLANMARPTIRGGKKAAEKIICGSGVAMLKRLKGLRGHHRRPKFLGGTEKQDLLWMDAEMHRAFHLVLHMILEARGLLGGLGGAGNGIAQWTEELKNPKNRAAAERAMRAASLFIDTLCKLKPPANLSSGL